MRNTVLVLLCVVSLFVERSFANEYVFEAGHPSLQKWVLPVKPPEPEDNQNTPERKALGKALFFDPRLSGDGNVSCASCHNPSLGWSDALPTSIGFRGKVLPRATPTIINTGYNTIQMWDGRERTLESQAVGPIESSAEMNFSLPHLVTFLKANSQYVEAFQLAYPNEGINASTIGKALANFQRGIVSRNSPFDRWVQGDEQALSEEQIKGFKLFVDPKKGNCEVCHSAPNFTDNGFHNLGLASFGEPDPDLGRYAIKPINVLKGAFKTPTLRDVVRTAPYFHDGSAGNLLDVMKHYVAGGVVKTHLSPNFTPIDLTPEEINSVIAFMQALSSPPIKIELPNLPTLSEEPTQ